MAFDEFLADRIRQFYSRKGIKTEEKKMMGGLCFMVDDKMCTGIVKNMLMARIGLEAYEAALKKDGCKEMDFTKRPMKGYVFVEPNALDTEKELAYWLELALAFNPLAKSSKRKKKS